MRNTSPVMRLVWFMVVLFVITTMQLLILQAATIHLPAPAQVTVTQIQVEE